MALTDGRRKHAMKTLRHADWAEVDVRDAEPHQLGLEGFAVSVWKEKYLLVYGGFAQM